MFFSSLYGPRAIRLALLGLGLASASVLPAQMVDVLTENFGGSSGTALSGTTADTFNADILAAGGSNVWDGGANFLSNGTITAESNNRCAWLNLGSWLNNAKGSAAGKFELTATLAPVSGAWISLGFATDNSPNASKNFTNTGTGTLPTTGMATIIYRSTTASPAGELDCFAGPTNTNAIDGPDNNTGSRTLTITLDLTPAGGYNGTTNFGTVRWSDSVLGTIGTYTYPVTASFGSILISESQSSGGTISALKLRQLDVDVPPTIQLKEPPDNSVQAAATAALVATFNEPVVPGTGTITLRKVQGQTVVESFTVPSSPRVQVVDKRLSIQPTTPLTPGVEYEVRITAGTVLDATGNSFAGLTTPGAWSFTVDRFQPVIYRTSPASGTTAADPSGALLLTFDEPILTGSGTLTLHRSSDGSAVQTFPAGTLVTNGPTVLIRPQAPLSLLTSYYITLSAGAITDLSGNPFPGLSGSEAWFFTTAASPPLLAESFTGNGGALQGTLADMFHPSLTAAGGSATWNAANAFRDHGTVNADASRSSASLNLGTLLDQAAGTPNGKFVLSLTLAETAGEWISVGFASEAVPGTSRNFTGAGTGPATTGLGTLLYRSPSSSPAGEFEYFAGPTTSNDFDGPDGNSGWRTLTVTLDLTPAGGYNGVSRFGTITWADSTIGVMGGYTFPSLQNFRSILLSKSASSGGTLRALSLRQDTAPSPVPFDLSLRTHANGLDFSWPTRPGRTYDLVSSTDLSTPPSTWPVWSSQGNLPSRGNATRLTNLPSQDQRRFFAINEKDARPNIVLIVADDLGYGSLSCYGATQVSTPAIDSLAASGLRLTDFHSNGPVCSPTRAALMTGRYQQRCALVPDADISPIFQQQRRNDPGQRWAWGMALQELTMAEALQQAGYRTGLVGKWHLGYDTQFHPSNQGFSSFRGFVGGGLDYHTHVASYGFESLDWWKDRSLANETGYATDLLSGYAVDFINNQQDQPFFLCVTHAAPHTPLQVRNPASFPNSTEAYRQMIVALDESVGAIISALQANGLREKTLVIFCSDNGPQANLPGWTPGAPWSGLKTDLLEGGHRVPCIISWPGQIPQGAVLNAPVMGMDFFRTFASLSGATLPPGHVLDGMDLMPILRGGPADPERVLHWAYDGDWAVRQGAWKLTGRNAAALKLVNLVTDPSEATNRLADEAGRANQMLLLHQQWTSEVGSQ